jgi:hypothetical protein
MDTETVQILLVNTGTTPIALEKMTFKSTEKDAMQSAILNGINRLGKQSHALIKFRDRLYTCDHTARKGPSTGYYRKEVPYHTFASELS